MVSDSKNKIFILNNCYKIDEIEFKKSLDIIKRLKRNPDFRLILFAVGPKTIPKFIILNSFK